MISNCPSCLNRLEHADDAMEVTCECGQVFHPFMTEGDLPPLTDINTGGSAPSETPEASEFSTSSALFQEIRDFGESLGSAPEAKSEPKPKPNAAKPATKSAPPAKGGAVSAGSGIFVISGENPAGFSIVDYFPPVSVVSDFDPESADPLKNAIDSLLGRAQGLGANGIVSVCWRFTPDGARCLISGTPVRAAKHA